MIGVFFVGVGKVIECISLPAAKTSNHVVLLKPASPLAFASFLQLVRPLFRMPSVPLCHTRKQTQKPPPFPAPLPHTPAAIFPDCSANRLVCCDLENLACGPSSRSTSPDLCLLTLSSCKPASTTISSALASAATPLRPL